MQQQMREAGSVNGSEQAPAPAPASSGASTTRDSLADVQSWVGFAQVNLAQPRGSAFLRDCILLDSQLSMDLFCNPALVLNPMQVKQTLHLSTNAGVLKTNMQANVTGYGKVWYYLKAIANVFSLAKVADKYWVQYDSNIEDAFTVHGPNQKVKFHLIAENLYIWVPKADDIKAGTALINTLQENKSFFTDRQIQKAELVKKILSTMAYPTINQLKAMVRMNMIRNSPVTLADVDLIEKVYGKDMPTIKGKTTRVAPTTVKFETIHIPRELRMAQSNVKLCINVMYVNKMPFLTMISRNIKFQTSGWVPDKTAKSYQEQLAKVLHLYKNAGFPITIINSDNEFRPKLEPMKHEFGFQPNYASAQEHVPEAERNHRVIKEHVRA